MFLKFPVSKYKTCLKLDTYIQIGAISFFSLTEMDISFSNCIYKTIHNKETNRRSWIESQIQTPHFNRWINTNTIPFEM